MAIDTLVNGNSITPAKWNAMQVAVENTTSGHDHDGSDSKWVGSVPIGGIIPWAKSITGVPALLANWKECDGSTVSDAASPINGQAVPNLNGNANFLYGATTSGGTKTEDFLVSHYHQKYIQNGTASAGSSSGVTSTETAGTAWTAYAVVWIIRIK